MKIMMFLFGFLGLVALARYVWLSSKSSTEFSRDARLGYPFDKKKALSYSLRMGVNAAFGPILIVIAASIGEPDVSLRMTVVGFSIPISMIMFFSCFSGGYLQLRYIFKAASGFNKKN